LNTWEKDTGEKIPYDEPSNELAEKEKEIGQMIMDKLNIGLGLYDLADIFWYDRL